MLKKIINNNIFLLILLSAIWGSAFIAIKIAVESTNSVTVASIRLIIGAIILYIYFKIKKYKFDYNIKLLITIFIIGLIGNFIHFFLISWSENYIKSNMAGLLLTFAPIFTILLAHFFTKNDKFTFKKLLAVLIGFLGVIFIFGEESLKDIFTGNSDTYIPKFAVILAGLGYVISAIIAYNLKKINTITLTTYVTIGAALVSIPFMIFVEFSNFSIPSSKSSLALIYLGIFPTALAFLLRFYLISEAGPTFLSYVAYLIPIFAIFWGYVFLNETINTSIFVGLILILFGTYIGQRN